MFHNIFSDISKFSVVKKANLHDALCRSCLSLFVAVNNVEQPDASFNSVQILQSTSKPSSYPHFFSIGNLIPCLLFTEVLTLFPKEKQASKFMF